MDSIDLTLADYLVILRRRIWQIVLAGVLLFAGITAVIFALPDLYRSSATILIEVKPAEFNSAITFKASP